MAIISLGKIDKNLIPIFIGGILCFLNRLLNQYKNTLLFKNVILSNICISTARFLAGLPYILILIRSKKEVFIQEDKINKIDLAKFIPRFNPQEKVDVSKGKNLYIILTSIINIIQSFLFVHTISIKSNAWTGYIVITAIFYYLFFQIKLYKHHYLSAIIILLLGITIDLVLNNLQTELIENISLLLLRYLREILLSFHFVLIKYIMEKKFVSVYEYTFKNGLLSLILFGIFSIFDHFFFKIDNYDEYFDNFNSTELLVMLGSIFSTLFLTLCILFTVKNNSPNHVFIIFVLGQFSYYINLEKYSVIVYICLSLLLLFSFIFNEIIEINFCGLSQNTKRNISSRANDESDSLYLRDESRESILKDSELEGYQIELNANDFR